MFGLGTVINTGAVIAGSLVGMTLKKGIPENCRQILMHACGVATIFIGAAGVLQKMLVIIGSSLETRGSLMLIFSLVFGSLIGELIKIEYRLECAGEYLKRKLHKIGRAHV